MAYDVFISYARGSAGSHAQSLAQALAEAELTVFFDTREIAPGAPFPDELAAAVLQARVVVVFADPEYFTRPWCVREFEAALKDREQCDRTIVVAAPAEGGAAAISIHLPPDLARRSWPRANQTETITNMVSRALDGTLSRELELPGTSPLLPEGRIPPKPWGAEQRTVALGAPDSLDEGFVGRAYALWQVFHALETRREGGPPRVVLLTGGGGTGKTQLAAEYLHRIGPRRYDIACWLHADVEPEEYEVQLRNVLATLAPDGAEGSSLHDAIARTCAALAADGKSLLWIVDNVPEPVADERPARISDWAPALDSASVLLTSRAPRLHGVDDKVTLDVLPLEDAVRALTLPDVDPRWLKASEWQEVARWVGGLPLALRILQCGLADGSLSAPGLLEKVRAAEPAAVLDRELAQLSETLPDGALRGVRQAFETSFAALSALPTARETLEVLAQLAPWPLEQDLLDALFETGDIALLARRGWLQSATGVNGQRTWRLHRVAGSFVRLHDGQFRGEEALLKRLHAAVVSSRFEPGPAHTLCKHLTTIAGPMVQRIKTADDFPEAVVSQGQAFGTEAAFYRIGEQQLRGLRYVGVEWARMFGAGVEVARRAAQIRADGDETLVAGLPHQLQGLGDLPEVAELIRELLTDPRDSVRWQAIIHAPAYAAGVIVEPLWHALLDEPNENVRANGLIGLHSLIPRGGEPVRRLLSLAASALQSSSPVHRFIAASTLGEVLFVRGEGLEEGGFRATSVRGALLRTACEDADDEVALAAARALGVRYTPESHARLSEAVRSAQGPARLRAIAVFGSYLRALDAPPRPDGVQLVIDDDGREELRGSLGNAGTPRPELSETLVEIAVSDADEASALAATGCLLGYASGKQALGQAVEAAFERNAPADVLRIASRCIEVEPDFADASWWRGMAQEELGDENGALGDYARVNELAPEFGYPHKRIAKILLARGDADAGLAALQQAHALIPDDPELQDLWARYGSAGTT